MKERKDSLCGARVGKTLKDCNDGDLSRGYFDAAPEGDFEGPGDTLTLWDDDKPKSGFVHRPLWKSDIERM